MKTVSIDAIDLYTAVNMTITKYKHGNKLNANSPTQHDFYHWHCQAFTQHIRSANQQVPVWNHFKGSNKHIFNF